jgi:hypothetical protein
MIFLTTNLNYLVPSINLTWCFVIMAALELPLNLPRQMKSLGWSSIAADIFLAVGIVLSYSFFTLENASAVDFVTWKTLPLFFGICTSAYEGIGVVRTISLLLPIFSVLINHFSLRCLFEQVKLTLYQTICAKTSDV